MQSKMEQLQSKMAPGFCSLATWQYFTWGIACQRGVTSRSMSSRNQFLSPCVSHFRSSSQQATSIPPIISGVIGVQGSHLFVGLCQFLEVFYETSRCSVRAARIESRPRHVFFLLTWSLQTSAVVVLGNRQRPPHPFQLIVYNGLVVFYCAVY